VEIELGQPEAIAVRATELLEISRLSVDDGVDGPALPEQEIGQEIAVLATRPRHHGDEVCAAHIHELIPGSL
jgi:hypothetical protein